MEKPKWPGHCFSFLDTLDLVVSWQRSWLCPRSSLLTPSQAQKRKRRRGDGSMLRGTTWAAPFLCSLTCSCSLPKWSRNQGGSILWFYRLSDPSWLDQSSPASPFWKFSSFGKVAQKSSGKGAWVTELVWVDNVMKGDGGEWKTIEA